MDGSDLSHLMTHKIRVELLVFCFCVLKYIIQIYFGITSGRVLDGELLYTRILEVNLFAFAYKLFHEDFSPIEAEPRRLERNLHETVCRQMQTNQRLESLCVLKYKLMFA